MCTIELRTRLAALTRASKSRELVAKVASLALDRHSASKVGCGKRAKWLLFHSDNLQKFAQQNMH